MAESELARKASWRDGFNVKPEHVRMTPSSRLSTVAKDEAAAADAKDVQATDEMDAAPATDQPKKGKALKGQIKQRPRQTFTDEAQLCMQVSRGEVCQFGDQCKYNHDIQKYLATKPADLGDKCFLFDRLGRCPYGYGCRFAKAHMTNDGQLVVREGAEISTLKNEQQNYLSQDLWYKLQRRIYSFERSKNACKDLNFNWSYKEGSDNKKREHDQVEPDEASAAATGGEASIKSSAIEEAAMSASDTTDVPLRQAEKIQLDFTGKLYLAPLTTVGNMPFRRICKSYGVDITCGEMALAQNVVGGNRTEWALLRRHECEDFFGVQIAGAYPDLMMRTADIINTHIDCDFVDINMGCPIDMAVNSGYGSALLSKERRLKDIVKGMLHVLDKPLTIKTRTGFTNNNLIANRLLPQLRDLGIAAATLHGRTKQQHYYHTANWDYVRHCAAEVQPLPLFGNGDIMSYDDYVKSMADSKLTGVMIARGALVKPWVFTEIKERKVWDISSSERFDMLKTFCNYGLEHWGSDTAGVNKTRRFLLEWQSFLHRYVPVGIIEAGLQRMNDRAPAFVGRDDLETLMGSPMSDDWIKLSELLLGKAPDGFVFRPKHKANSSELVQQQG